MKCNRATSTCKCPHSAPHDCPTAEAVCSEGGKVKCEKEKNLSTETREETETPYLPPAIEMIPVESSNILGFGHDSNQTLRVWFKNGTRYDYIGISETEFFDLVNAPSPGKAYNALVKGEGVKGIKL